MKVANTHTQDSQNSPNNNQFLLIQNPQSLNIQDQVSITNKNNDFSQFRLSQNLNVQERFYQVYADLCSNIHDPILCRQNNVKKQNSSLHLNCIIGTLVLIAGILVSAIILNRLHELFFKGVIMVTCYIIYLIAAILCSSIWQIFGNITNMDEYKRKYQAMVNANCFFIFTIQCYHYEGQKNQRKKVISHTATQNFAPLDCIDESGNLQKVNDLQKYMYVKYFKKFYFMDDGSQQRFEQAYKKFIQTNTQDKYQNYKCSFEIPDFEQQVCFTTEHQNSFSCILYYVTTLLGLGIPFVCYFQNSLSRYSINILKKIRF